MISELSDGIWTLAEFVAWAFAGRDIQQGFNGESWLNAGTWIESTCFVDEKFYSDGTPRYEASSVDNGNCETTLIATRKTLKAAINACERHARKAGLR
jgi:hypothetical protein